MRTSVVLVSRTTQRLAALSWKLSATGLGVTMVRGSQPLAQARACPMHAGVMLVDLAGDENVAEIRDLFAQRPGTRLLLTLPDMPPPAALARVVRERGGLLVGAEESDVVTVAAIIALAAHRSLERAHA